MGFWDNDDDEREEAERDAYNYRTKWSNYAGAKDKIDEADDKLGRTQSERDYEDDKWGYNR